MKAIKINSISKDETFVIKAIGIILIVLHNYYRWIEPITGENEFYFSENHIQNSYKFITGNALELVNIFFNYLGHYGVQIFIFISAYGLTKAYINKSITYGAFFQKRFAKLYPTLLLSAFAMILFNVIAHGNLPTKGDLIDIGIQLSLLSTFVPNKALVMVGPWWFYSFIFQFYLLFPILLKYYKKYKNYFLLLLSLGGYLIVIFLNPALSQYKINLMQTVFGHLPEFCLGIWLADRKEIRINIWIFITTLIVFLLGNYFKVFWYFSHLTVIILLLPILKISARFIGKYELINKIMIFIGIVSVYLFATHGFLRWNAVGLANSLNHPVAEFLTGILFLLFSIGFSWMLLSADRQMRLWVNKAQTKNIRLRRIVVFVILLGGLAISVKACQSINYANSKKKEKEKIDQCVIVKESSKINFRQK